MRFTTLLLLLSVSAQAQFSHYCGSDRYDKEVFSTVQVTSGVNFGFAQSVGGGSMPLNLDVYQPSGDTAAVRPLIVWAHGGSFVGGSRTDADVVALCNHFAKRGYVCASIDYRLGLGTFPPNEQAVTEAVWRAVQDMKAAIRFFSKDAVTGNLYKIDTSLIVAAGSSAGAFTALHLAYLDEDSEIPALIDTNTVGGLEGNSGNPGYPSHVNAVVNLCGALGSANYIQPGDIPFVSMHGTDDQTVPYATATIVFIGIFPLMPVDGSYTIAQHADSIGLTNDFYTYYGAGHVPYLSDVSYMDTTVRFVSNFLYRFMGCNPSDPNPLPNTFPSYIDHVEEISAWVYPNPVLHAMSIDCEGLGEARVRIIDGLGRILIEKEIFDKGVIELDHLAPGMYYYFLYTREGNKKGAFLKM